MNCRFYRPVVRRSPIGLWFVLTLSLLGVSSCGSGQLLTTPSASSDAPREEAETTNSPPVTAKSLKAVEYQTYELPTSLVHVVTVPPTSDRQVTVAWSEELETLASLAQSAGAIAAINAGFFDPQNGLTTSYIIADGAIVATPQQNPRLMENPALQAYLPAILNRSEFRVYDCEDGVQYDIAPRSTSIPANCRLNSAVGAGPQLLPTLTGYEEGFLADDPAGEIVRDALGSQAANARSAVGVKADGTVVLAIAAQLPDVDFPTGLTLAEMANFLKQLGVEKALNLDGGSSTSLYFQGQTYLGRLDDTGIPIERPIKSALLIQ